MPSVPIEIHTEYHYVLINDVRGRYVTMQGQRIAQGGDAVRVIQSVFASVIHELLFAMLRWRLYHDWRSVLRRGCFAYKSRWLLLNPLILVRRPEFVRKGITSSTPEAVNNVLLHSGRG